MPDIISKSNDRIILDNTIAQIKEQRGQTLSDSDFFELFTAEQILKDYDLSYEEIKSGLVGGGGDGGIDSAYLFINSELMQEDSDFRRFKKNPTINFHLIQSKRTPSFNEDGMRKFYTITEELFDLSHDLTDYTTVYNEKLLGIVGLFRQATTDLASKLPNLKISYYYATRGDQIHKNVRRFEPKIEKFVINLFSSASFKFNFLGSTELLELVRHLPRTTFTLRLSESIAAEEDASLVCLVPLNEYKNFITKDDNTLRLNLFEANVRDYQGKVEVNKAIGNTLLSAHSEDFWWLNNGVTVVASQASLSGKTLVVEDPQIVNGLQTSREIFKYYTDRDTSDDQRNILIKVIVPVEEESRDRIIKATNFQTAIPLPSLHATEKIHRDIEDYLRANGLYYDRRKNFYKNEGMPIDKIISISFVAQSVMAVLLQEPDNARARPTSLLKKDYDYNRIFNTSIPIEMYYKCIKIALLATEFLKKMKKPALHPKDINNIRFHLVMYASAKIANKLAPTPNDLLKIEISKLDTTFFRKCLVPVFETYAHLGGDDQAAKGPEFVQHLKEKLRSVIDQ